MAESKWPIIWDARWIWAGPAPLPVSPIGAAGIPPKETWNRFCYLRRTVQLDAIPASVPARVTADSRYVLFVNGVEVARGPARSIPERLAWTEIDLAPYLHHPAALIPAIALSIVLQITLAAGVYLLAAGLGMTVPLSLFILCVPIANVFASLPLTLNGLGIRESAYLVLFGMAGMRKEDAIALGLLWFAVTVVGGLTGAIAFMTTPAPIPGEG